MRSSLVHVAISTALYLASSGCTDASESNDAHLDVNVAVEPPGSACAAGGQRIDVTVGGTTTTSYVCNGGDGDPASIVIADEPPGARCASGGVAITTVSGGTSVTSYVCNGNASVIATAEPPGAHCAAGGIALTDSAGDVSYVCNGAPGQNVVVAAADPAVCPSGGAELSVGGGASLDVCNGANGESVTLAVEPPGSHCAAGGVVLAVGDGAPSYVCNGISGSEPAITVVGPGSPCPYGGLAVTVGVAPPAYVCNGAPGADGESVTVTPEPISDACPAGGVALGVGATPPSLVCNGRDGDSAIVTAVASGAACPYGGVSIQVGASVPAYVCNGAPGAAGESVTITPEPAGGHCEHGGLAFSVGNGPPQYACNGADGQSVTVTTEPRGSHCPYGGVAFHVGASPPAYACNGAQLAWTTISALTIAQPQFGYVSTAASTITLSLPPATAFSVGDAIELFVQGEGAVRVQPNIGESFRHGGELSVADAWSYQTLLPAPGHAIASSADGTRLVAATGDTIAVSRNGGVTWESNLTVSGTNWSSVASSADGLTLVATRINGPARISYDGGATWNTSSAAPRHVAISGDGRRIATIAVGQVLLSVDGGATWAAAGLQSPDLSRVSMSADGMRLVATEDTYQHHAVFASTDGGTTWTGVLTPSTGVMGQIDYFVRAMWSADGARLYVIDGDVLHASSDAGQTFFTCAAPDRMWSDLAVSADGTRLAALAVDGTIFTSADSCHTWRQTHATDPYTAIASSADGTHVVAVGDVGAINGQPFALVAHAGSTLRLVYSGNGIFFVAGVTGTVDAP